MLWAVSSKGAGKYGLKGAMGQTSTLPQHDGRLQLWRERQSSAALLPGGIRMHDGGLQGWSIGHRGIILWAYTSQSHRGR